jgi:hypothetical protein
MNGFSNIVRHTPDAHYHGNPVLIPPIVLPRSTFVECLEYNYNRVPTSPAWYEDVVEDILDAFVYHECVLPFEKALRVFKGACRLRQGDKYERIKLSPRAVSDGADDNNGLEGLGYRDDGRSKRRRTTHLEVTAPAKVMSNAADANDEALALSCREGIMRRSCRTTP